MDQIRKQGLGLATISYDAPDTIAAFAKQRGITFPMLSDAGSATIRRYGILNTVAMELLGPNAKDPALAEDIRTYVSVVAPSARMAGIAFPGTFVLDREGRVRSRFFEDFYIERNTVSGIVARVGAGDAPVQGVQVSTEHLELRTHPSDAAVAPGNRFSLIFSITPRANMHVYAPGAAGYRVIAVNLAPQPFVRVLPLSYPASEIYFFKPLNERVPVFQKPFTLVQELILEGRPEAQAALRGRDSLTLTGTLDYQACDDEICYNPISVPLSWTVSLRPLVTQRSTQ